MKAAFAILGLLATTSFSVGTYAAVSLVARKETKSIVSQYNHDGAKGSYNSCLYIVKTDFTDKPDVIAVTLHAADEKSKLYPSSNIYSNGTDVVMIEKSDLPLSEGFARSTNETNEKFTAQVSVSYRGGVLSIDRKVTYHEEFLSLYMGGSTSTHAEIKVSADLKKVVSAKGTDNRRIESYYTFGGVTKHQGTSLTKASFSCQF